MNRVLFKLTSEGEIEISQNCGKNAWKSNNHLRSINKKDIDLIDKRVNFLVNIKYQAAEVVKTKTETDTVGHITEGLLSHTETLNFV